MDVFTFVGEDELATVPDVHIAIAVSALGHVAHLVVLDQQVFLRTTFPFPAHQSPCLAFFGQVGEVLGIGSPTAQERHEHGEDCDHGGEAVSQFDHRDLSSNQPPAGGSKRSRCEAAPAGSRRGIVALR
jgi:hypothetical protein